jgi:cadmium resistance protein CadD (predicted permease)
VRWTAGRRVRRVTSWAAAGTGLGVFAGTNIDDLLVLTVLFVSARAGRPRRWEIVTGQVLGFTALLAASVAIAVGLGAVPERWIRLFGVIPLGIGGWGLWRGLRRPDDTDPPSLAAGVWSVAALTMANGADNLSIYPPVLRALGVGPAVVTGVVFYVGVAVWCAAGVLLSRPKGVVTALGKVQHWLGPLVFIALGVVILLNVL